jgi:RNA polymerase sigma-70 factor (TIGR02960 family)
MMQKEAFAPRRASSCRQIRETVRLEAIVDAGNKVEIERLVAAVAGDERAFAELTQPVQRELHVHCYRMLGTIDDADDALQETLMRAWRQIDRFEPRAPFRAWLYRIATNVCLTMLARRARRGEVFATSTENDGAEDRLFLGEQVHLDPYPDHLLDELMTSPPGPEETIEQEESVELAFVAAVQLLPPRQRATLLLRDVIGYSATEVATMLATSVAGINSTLQRARATLDQERIAARVTRVHTRTSSTTEQALVRRLVAAWQSADIPSIVDLLTEDAVFTMPPLPLRFVGRDEIGNFLATVPGGGRLDRFRLVPIRANRQPAFAVYYRDDDYGPFEAHAVLVIAIERDTIASLTRFTNPDLFTRFALPATFDD